MNLRKLTARLLLALPLLALIGMGGLSCASATAPSSGLVEGRLRPCPASPNCVSSQAAADAEAFIEPLTYAGTGDEAFERLNTWLQEQPRTRLLSREGDYAHYEVTTRLLRFRDDLEFQLAEDENVIHVRSASRVGHSDLGANRKRIEAIRAAWPQANPTSASSQ